MPAHSPRAGMWMALKKECPNCRYRNAISKRKCVRCGVSLTSPAVVYWVDVWLHGRRVRERIGPSRSAAKARELELKRREAQVKARGTSWLAENTRLEDLWPRYYLWCRSHNRSPETKRYRWKAHLKSFFGNKFLRDITLRLAEEYKFMNRPGFAGE